MINYKINIMNGKLRVEVYVNAELFEVISTDVFDSVDYELKLQQEYEQTKDIGEKPADHIPNTS